jgi:hypothetical protein
MKFTNKKLEGYGLILILFSFGWEYLEYNLDNINNDVEQYQIHQKLDYLYRITSTVYTNSEYNTTGIRSSTDFEYINKNWKGWNSLKQEKEGVSSQLEITLAVKSFIFILGSLLLIIPKFRRDSIE